MVDQNPQLHNSETSQLASLKQIHHTYDKCLKINHIYIYITTADELTQGPS